MPDYSAQRLNMVESQVRANDVTDVRIQEAMREVHRELFLPEQKRPLAYSDAVVEVGHGRFLLDPRTFSKLAQLAQIAPGDRVLDVGCASGYSTAVLARLAAVVTAVEEDGDLAEQASQLLPACGVNARAVRAMLSEGCSSNAPYDAIFVNGATETEPLGLLEQLAESGRLVAVVREGMRSRAHVFVRDHGRISTRPDFDAYVPILPGFAHPKAFAF
jgi:protein-L-isoaspartate(D-aspartate) O-methyltransferase